MFWGCITTKGMVKCATSKDSDQTAHPQSDQSSLTTHGLYLYSVTNTNWAAWMRRHIWTLLHHIHLKGRFLLMQLISDIYQGNTNNDSSNSPGQLWWISYIQCFNSQQLIYYNKTNEWMIYAVFWWHRGRFNVTPKNVHDVILIRI